MLANKNVIVDHNFPLLAQTYKEIVKNSPKNGKNKVKKEVIKRSQIISLPKIQQQKTQSINDKEVVDASNDV